jgi:hypothetical protein
VSKITLGLVVALGIVLSSCAGTGIDKTVLSPSPSITPSITPTAGTTPLAAPTTLDETAAWPLVRQAIPGALVLRPAVLPSGFGRTPVTIEYAYVAPDGSPRYRVGYAGSDGRTLLFALGAVNSSRPVSQMTVTIRGVTGEYSRTDSWPAAQLTWTEAGQFYSIQTSAVLSSDEMSRIGSSLAAVP